MKDQAVGADTQKEIFGQPILWKAVYQLVTDHRASLKTFLDPIFQLSGLQIILTGAGSSAFIGEAAQGLIHLQTQHPCRAVPTTDLVTFPHLFFSRNQPTLLVSFARSGNSPESVQAVRLADNYCQQIFHLVVTCNRTGKLLQRYQDRKENTFCLILPERANDKSLAMTGSFTSMLLCALLATDLQHLEEKSVVLNKILQQAEAILSRHDEIRTVAEQDYERVVFLGSGPMTGIARECELKLQELTDGKVICKHDSFLGFRHGPKAVINPETLVVYLYAENPYVYQYERDLARELTGIPQMHGTIHIGNDIPDDPHALLTMVFEKTTFGYHIIPTAIIGQLLGYYKSMALGLDPDNPSVSGTISRVVRGVTLYGEDLF